MTSREALRDEFVEDALDAYAEKEEELGSRADARRRALHHPRRRRPALARAPRRDGLPPRGRPPARVRAEGPARRVPLRGPRDVRGARARRSARRSCSRSSTPRSRSQPQEQLQPAEQGNGNLQYQHETSSGAEAIAGAATAGGDQRRRRLERHRSRRAAPGHDHERASRRRPQRPLLVRLGQEVQEVPRRLTRRAAAPDRTSAPTAFVGAPARGSPGLSPRVSVLSPGGTHGRSPSRPARRSRTAGRYHPARWPEQTLTLDQQLEEIRARLAWVRDYL